MRAEQLLLAVDANAGLAGLFVQTVFRLTEEESGRGGAKAGAKLEPKWNPACPRLSQPLSPTRGGTLFPAFSKDFRQIGVLRPQLNSSVPKF